MEYSMLFNVLSCIKGGSQEPPFLFAWQKDLPLVRYD